MGSERKSRGVGGRVLREVHSRDQDTGLYRDMQEWSVQTNKRKSLNRKTRKRRDEKEVYERSNPAPELMACKSFALRTLSSAYIGSFNRLTQVLAVGSRSLSLPASRIANFGTSSLNPLLEQGQKSGKEGKRKLTVTAADYSS